MIKLIASDMDGTLLNNNHVISEENIKAIREAQKRGIDFAIATGRDYADVEPFLKQYNLKCESIVSNGAEYRDVDGNIIESIDIDKALVEKVFNIMDKYGLKAELFTSDGIYTPNSREEALKGTIYMLSTFLKISTEEAEKLAKKDEKINVQAVNDLILTFKKLYLNPQGRLKQLLIKGSEEGMKIP